MADWRQRNDRGGPANRLGTRIRHLTAWDWLVGMVVSVALILGLAFMGHGLYIQAKAALAQALLDRAWAQTLARNDIHKPWPWFDSWPVARISIPRLDRQAVILAGASGQALAFGPTHVNGTAAPGQPGTIVYAAHRDTHFTFMGELTRGDIIQVTSRTGTQYAYRVEGFRVARWDRSGLDPAVPGRLVLVTCWPLDAQSAGPLRYLAEAVLVDKPETLLTAAR